MHIAKEKIVEYIDSLIDLALDKKNNNLFSREDLFELSSEYNKFKRLVNEGSEFPLKYKNIINSYMFDAKAHLNYHFKSKFFRFLFDLEDHSPYNIDALEKAHSNIDRLIQNLYIFRIETLKL